MYSVSKQIAELKKQLSKSPAQIQEEENAYKNQQEKARKEIKSKKEILNVEDLKKAAEKEKGTVLLTSQKHLVEFNFLSEEIFSIRGYKFKLNEIDFLGHNQIKNNFYITYKNSYRITTIPKTQLKKLFALYENDKSQKLRKNINNF